MAPWRATKQDWLLKGIHKHMALIPTFAPIAKMNTIRILLSLATNFDLPLQQFSVKINLLHTDQEVEVYMDILPRYEKESWKNKVCKLKKNHYMVLSNRLKHGLENLWKLWCREIIIKAKVITHYLSHSNLGKIANIDCVCWWYCYHWKWPRRDYRTVIMLS